jgi:hypothetical protein
MRVVPQSAPAASAGQFVFSKQLLRTSFRRPAVGTPRTSGNGELIHLMQNDGFYRESLIFLSVVFHARRVVKLFSAVQQLGATLSL